jgi:hypothetical protein
MLLFVIRKKEWDLMFSFGGLILIQGFEIWKEFL